MELSKEKIINEYIKNLKKNNNNLVVDIDGVIASLVSNSDYINSKPITKNIDYINKLHRAGIKIILFTARGSISGKNWKNLTEQQLKKWGVLHDELIFGKPAGDLYIDDKAATPSVLEILADQINN